MFWSSLSEGAQLEVDEWKVGVFCHRLDSRLSVNVSRLAMKVYKTWFCPLGVALWS